MKVFFHPTARQDIATQVQYLLDEFAYDAAERFPAAVDSAAQFVVAHPHAGAPSMAGLRSWAIPGFQRIRIFYHCPTTNDLHIARVLHTARDVESLIKGWP